MFVSIHRHINWYLNVPEHIYIALWIVDRGNRLAVKEGRGFCNRSGVHTSLIIRTTRASSTYVSLARNRWLLFFLIKSRHTTCLESLVPLTPHIYTPSIKHFSAKTTNTEAVVAERPYE